MGLRGTVATGLVATTLISIGGAVAEQEHVQPIPQITHQAGDIGSFVLDRFGDVVDFGENVVNNPEVHVEKADGSVEHGHYDDPFRDIGEAGLMGFLFYRLAAFGLRRRRHSQESADSADH